MVLQAHFGVSERRACRVTGQYRSTQRKSGRPHSVEEDKLRRRLRAIATAPRWGWKTAHRLSQAPPSEPGHRPTAGRQPPDHVGAIDFQFDETSDGRRLKLANMARYSRS